MRDGSAGKLPEGADLSVASRRRWNNRKYGASKLRFPHAEEFLQKLSAHSKNIPQPCPESRKFI